MNDVKEDDYKQSELVIISKRIEEYQLKYNYSWVKK